MSEPSIRFRAAWFSRFLIASALILLPLAFASASRWERYYQWDYNEGARCVVQSLPDSCFVITGTTWSAGPGFPDHGNPFLLKLDPAGNALWFQTYGTEADEYGASVARTPDGGFLIGGSRTHPEDMTNDFYVIKTASDGRLEWDRTYGESRWMDDCLAVASVRIGGYVIAGCSSDFQTWTPNTVHMFRVNTMGSVMWVLKYREPGYGDMPWSVQETPDGGFIVGATAVGEVYYMDRHMLLMKVTRRGEIKWTRSYLSNTGAGCQCVRVASDGGYILAGYSSIHDPNHSDMALVKTDSEGNEQWKTIFGGTNGSDGAYSVQETPDGGFIACGTTGSYGHGAFDLLILRVDRNGRPLWYRTYGGRSAEIGYSILQLADGGSITVGEEWSWGPGGGIYVVKADANGNVGLERTGAPQLRLAPAPLTVTPNPFVSFAAIPGKDREKYIVYDVLGRTVGRYAGERIGGDLPAGIYLVRGETGSGPAIRIVKTR